MKVLHIIPSVSPRRGGPSFHTLEIVRNLRNLGVEAEIATTNDHGNELMPVAVGSLIQYEHLPVWFFRKRLSGLTPLREFTFSQEFVRWLKMHLDGYDLLHVHACFSHVSTAAMALARVRGKPYMVTPHGLLCRWSLAQSRWRKLIYWRLIERRNLNGASVVRFTSNAERNEAAALGLSCPSVVIPFSLAPAASLASARHDLRERLGVWQGTAVILFLSRLHPKKNLELVLESMASLDRTGSHLAIAGEGDPAYVGQLKRRISALQLDSRVTFLGFLSGESKAMALQGADLFVLPSRSENLGIAVLEAMLSGLPMVLSSGVPLAPLVERLGIGKVTDLTVRGFSAALRGLLDRPIPWDIRERGRRYVEDNFNQRKLAKSMADVYHAVVTGQRITPSSTQSPL